MTTMTDADQEDAIELVGILDLGTWALLPIAESFARHRTAAHAAGLAEGVALGIEAMRQSVEEAEGKGVADYCVGPLDTPAGISAIIAAHRAKALDELAGGGE
jgi:hypothetical protein